ncbi:MAG: 3'-5' exonuclease [Actinomycetota bacterium]|nr:3'-5' exonuclease [Actinomycetota bacterium]
MDSLMPKQQHVEDRPGSTRDRVAAAQWARELLARKDFVVFDSETTGLSSPVDFVGIAVVSPKGETLFDSLLKPSCRIEPSARVIHGHSAKSLSGAPRFFEVYADLLEVLYQRRVIVFNASYDRRVWDEAIRHLGAREALAGVLPRWECAMRQYARFVGERSKRGKGYRPQKLPGGDHTALGDALATLRLIERMAEG